MTRTKSNSSTIRDVARRAEVSIATVSRYLNRRESVSPEAAARLEQVMLELQYVPQASARGLATHHTHSIGLRLADIMGEFFAPLLKGIEAVSSEAGYDLLVSCTRLPLQPGAQLPLGPHNTDGLLVFADGLEDSHLARLHAAGFPIVLIHRTPPPELGIPCVTVENKAATRQVVSHLIEAHGRRRIAFVGGLPQQEDSYWREQGYRQALERAGLPLDPALMTVGEFDRQVAEIAVRYLIASGVAFDGVFCGDDESAVGVLKALRAAGRRVPQDVSVAGFDDQRMSAYLDPPLTTVRAPTYAVGQEAARQLIRLIQGKPATAPKILLPVEVILRRSCGCGE